MPHRQQSSRGNQWIAGILLWGLLGCQQWGLRPPGLALPRLPGLALPSTRSQSPEHDDGLEDEFETSVEVPFVGDYTTIGGLNLIALQGVGLVTGLSGTGSDPPPSSFRTRLVHDMRRRGVRDPNTILRSPSTALVVVQAYLPPLIRKGERFDVEVRVPGVDETSSLNGGWLMETYLSEHAIVPGQGPMKGHLYATAKGPILISTGEGSDESRAALLRRGRVLGGGLSLKDRNLGLYLRNDFRSVRNSKRIADRIGRRFSDYDRSGLKRPLAEAKTDQRIELIVPLHYRDNYPRYLQVIRNIAFRESNVEQRVRMQKLKQELHAPETSEVAALRLEAIGTAAIPVLRSGLNNPLLEVRFHAAMALAYLGQSDGLRTLAEAARDEPAFRVFALAALAASEDAEASLQLRELLHERSAETRYGAWRALTTSDRRDPIVRDERISDEFQFHVLETTGPPMIHLTNRKKAEIVLFGRDQQFQTPLALRAGEDILVTAPAGGRTVIVSRYEVGQPDRRKVVSTRIAEVIRAVAELEATYPDVAQMLAQADKQQNVPGTIEVDAVPQSGRLYYRPEANLAGKTQVETQVGHAGLSPNLFDMRGGEDRQRREKSDGRFGEINLDAGLATAVDFREPSEEDEATKEGAGAPDEEDVTPIGGMFRKWFDPAELWKWPFGRKEGRDEAGDEQ